MTFEKNLERLEQIAASLDRDDLSLEQALTLFEEGIAKLKEASGELAKAEGRVAKLVEKAEGVFEVRPSAGPDARD
ncbi:MAG: exodeoxyribonuclease VII small subunit [Gemmatimonadaceae bacterium]